jgi:hypothetical protein
MVAFEEFSTLAQMYKDEHQCAFQLYGEGKDDVKSDEALRICRQCLLESYVGPWHHAGFHLLLEHSDDGELSKLQSNSLTNSQ